MICLDILKSAWSPVYTIVRQFHFIPFKNLTSTDSNSTQLNLKKKIQTNEIMRGKKPPKKQKTAMISLQSLLSTPEPSDPQDAVVAQHFMTDKLSFERTAKYWTKIFAMTEILSERRSSNPVDEIMMAGLESNHVEQ